MSRKLPQILQAQRIHVRGVVQGVGFRPFVYRAARRHGVRGWVLNAGKGVEIHVEGAPEALAAFAEEVENAPPPAARVAQFETTAAELEDFEAFSIRESEDAGQPTVRIAPDLPVCDDCLGELFDPADRRHRYAYVNCTNCGPRYSIIEGLPYDRPQTTMAGWPMCSGCAQEYDDPTDRRFHAQPVACPRCGPQYFLRTEDEEVARAEEAVAQSAERLRKGKILAVKGLGGYHLACDARNEEAVQQLRERKFRKEKPFAVMARDLDEARCLVALSEEGEALLTSTPRPVVLAPSKAELLGVAPGNAELGVMLPYTPLHHLLFDRGASAALVMTSANRSSEPIAYRDADAFDRLAGLADAYLAGERPIARRVDDSVARAGPFGPTVLRRSRGYAPGAVAQFPIDRPILAVGADLKNTVTLVVDGQAFLSQHVGDLKHLAAQEAFRETIDDLLRMYEVDQSDLLVACDRHPQYTSTRHAQEMPGEQRAVQHHRAHVASVLAEREAWDKRVVGVVFDGTGYGSDESDDGSPDGSIWGGEVFVGSLAEGCERAAHLRPAVLPGGDAAAKAPVQAAAGFLAQLDDLPDLTAPPFAFPSRYRQARELVRKDVRTFPTTSVGRLFDTVAALLGFTREMTFEGQAAIWLEHQARAASSVQAYPFPELDFRPLLEAVITDRLRGRPASEIARAFHRGLAQGLFETAQRLCDARGLDTLVCSGGVFQNQLLLREIKALSDAAPGLTVWTNRAVPPNDGGISLGQAALAAMRRG